MLASSSSKQSFLLLVLAATILSSTTGVAAVDLRSRFLGSIFKQQQYQSSRRELNQVNGFARCPSGCDLDASGCVQAGTPGSLRCEQCLNSLLVNKTSGACGGWARWTWLRTQSPTIAAMHCKKICSLEIALQGALLAGTQLDPTARTLKRASGQRAACLMGKGRRERCSAQPT